MRLTLSYKLFQGRKSPSPRIGPADLGAKAWSSVLISIMFDIIGMTGTFLVVGAFFLLQLEKVNPTGITYNIMNLSGAILLLISLCYNFNLASFVIEIFWIAASLIGLYKYYKARKVKHEVPVSAEVCK
jgi:predicted membrane protein